MTRLLYVALLLVFLIPLSALGSQTADLNRDGFTDGLDLGVLLGEWGPDYVYVYNPEFSNPDYNHDGFVDGLDLGILLAEWDPPVRPSAAYAVPEPTTATLLLTCCALPAVLRRRR